ncbi:MAG: hypothetical protein ACHQFZ_00820 [Acidimicrobiales bacterium]
MAHQLILGFTGVTEEQYWAVDRALGTHMASDHGDIPPGLRSHTFGRTADGEFLVTEVWDTVEDQQAFMDARLGRALVEGGITGPPSQMTWLEVLAHRDFAD